MWGNPHTFGTSDIATRRACFAESVLQEIPSQEASKQLALSVVTCKQGIKAWRWPTNEAAVILCLFMRTQSRTELNLMPTQSTAKRLLSLHEGKMPIKNLWVKERGGHLL